MTFFGKLHALPQFFVERTFPSSVVLLEHQVCFKREHKSCLSGPSARIPTVSSLFAKRLYLLITQGHLGRDGEGTFGEKKIGPQARKTKYLIANAMHKTMYGRALN